MRATSSTVSVSASGPRCASSSLTWSGRSSQTPARFFAPASVSCSSPPSTNRRRNAGVFAPFAPLATYLRRPALIRCTITTSSPSSVGSRKRLARRSTPAEALAVERRERRVEGLERRDVRRTGFLDRRSLDEWVELAPPGFDLGQLRQLGSPAGVDAIRVTVQRGDVVEAVHHVHVRSTDGTALGEDVHCFLRSSLKPIQAIPLARGLRRPRLRRARDRERLSPGRAGAARRGAEAARARRRRGRRPRVRLAGRASGRAARAQLLGQARRDARRVPRARLAAAPVSRALASAAAASRRARRTGGRRRRRLRRADVRTGALRDGGALRHDPGADRSRHARASRARRRQTARTTPT